MVDRVRQVLEELRLQQVLKTSAESTVFRASDPGSGRDVILKVVNPVLPELHPAGAARFEAFVTAVQAADAAGLPEVYDWGFTPDHGAFLMLEPVAGEPVDQLDDRSITRRLGILMDVLATLEVLAADGHALANLVADNVLVHREGARDTVHLLGMGTSAFLVGVRPEIWPGASMAVEALPPEVAEGTADPRADLWSLARLACRLLELRVVAPDDARPTPVATDAQRKILGDSALLCGTLGAALVRDPQARAVTAADIRDALIRAMPMELEAQLPPLGDLEEADPRLAKTMRLELPKDMVTSAGEDRAAARERVTSDEENPLLTTVRIPIPDVTPPGTAPGDDRPDPAPVQADDLTVQRAEPPPPPRPAPPPADDLPPPAPLPDQPEVAPAAEPASSPRPARGAQILERGRSALTAAVDALRKVEWRQLPWRQIAIGGGLVVVLAVVIVLMRSLTDPREAPPPLPTATPRPAPTPVPTPAEPAVDPVDPALLAAQELLTEGDLDGARDAVADFDPDPLDGLSEEEQQIWDDLQAAFEGADIEAAARELRQGLQLGSIPMIRRATGALSSATDADLEADPTLTDTLEKARRILRLHRRMWDASDEGDRLTVLETSAVLIRELPEYSGAPAKREQAAASIELEAEQLIRQRRFGDAVRLLSALEERWPERDGVSERISWCRRQMATADELGKVLEQARAAGEAGDPEAGLAMLEGLDVPAVFADRVAATRRSLEDRLARLDNEYPTVEMPDGFELAFRKNRSLTVPLRVSDDFRVESVVALVRSAEGGDWNEIQLEESGDGVYPLQIGPALHGNEDLEFFVIATDASGHETRLGGPDGPLRVERKKWFQR